MILPLNAQISKVYFVLIYKHYLEIQKGEKKQQNNTQVLSFSLKEISNSEQITVILKENTFS